MVCLTIVLSSCKMTLKDIVKEAEQATFVIYTYDEYGKLPKLAY